MRHRDIHLLTAGRSTYTSDQRFQSVHNPHTEDWVLQVKKLYLIKNNIFNFNYMALKYTVTTQ